MTLKSDLFKNSVRLQRCATQDAAHVILNDTGDHVGRIQTALIRLDSASIERTELAKQRYGKSTAGAVLAYKTAREIINKSYQKKPDDIVGKMTIVRLDEELLGNAPSPQRQYTTKFLPSPRRPARSAVGFTAVGDNFAPVGPVLRGNGYDPTPNGAGVGGPAWQMVPVGGERHLFLSTPPGTRYRFEFEKITGSNPEQCLDKSEVLPSEVAGLQEIRLVGKTEGWANLRAINASNGAVAAELSINVLERKSFRIGFVLLSDRKHKVEKKLQDGAFIKRFNEIWTPQANIAATSGGAVSIALPADLGAAPSQKELEAASPAILNAAKAKLGTCDRVVAVVWDFVPDHPNLIGLGMDVIFLKPIVEPSSSTFAHEFGHTRGLGHSMAEGDGLNLMFSGVVPGFVQDKLNFREIMMANPHPRTWRDVQD